MCGIVGYIGNREAQEILLKSLSRLEYRGYDSAGLAIINKKNKICIVKKQGKLSILSEKLESNPLDGTVGIGHCLAPDTLVYLSDGRIVPISSIKDGQEVYALNLTSLCLEPAKVKVMKHRSPEYLYNLRTPLTTIKCTGHHKMFIISDGKIIEKRVEELKKGDRLIIPDTSGIEGRKILFRKFFVKRYLKMTSTANRLVKDRIREAKFTIAQCAASAGMSEAYMSHIMNNDRNFREDRIDELSKTLAIEIGPAYFIPQDSRHGKYVKLPEQSSPELLRIIGYLLGDGTVKERCIRFKDADKATLHFYEGLIENVFGAKGRVVSVKGANAWLLEVNSLSLCQWLRENVISRKMEFLSELGQLPIEEAAAFLKGIFDAEGCVNTRSNQISLRLTNKNIVRLAQLLLLRLGIATSFYTEKKKVKNWNDSYGVFISNSHSFRIFESFVGFCSSMKSNKLRLLAAKKSGKASLPAEYKLTSQPVFSINKTKSDEAFLFDLEVDHPSASFIANGLVSHNSRWATHGVPNDVNAHPHLDCKGKIAIVHNGIIENYLELKGQLLREGHKFLSETDTEIIVHLIEKFYKGNLENAVSKAAKLLHGSYALAVIDKTEPQKIVGARRDSPLLVRRLQAFPNPTLRGPPRRSIFLIASSV